MALYRQVFQTQNRWTFLIDGTARAAIEAALVSTLAPGDEAVIVNAGRFGLLLMEIAERCGARITSIESEWGQVVDPNAVEDAVRRVRPRLVACVHGDTSTTMLQPLAEIGALCRKHDALLYVDCTASLGGNAFEMDDWQIDMASAGLQKCLSGPSGSAPISFNDRAAAVVNARKHIEEGIRNADIQEGDGPIIRSNYFDLAMLMEYWSARRLNGTARRSQIHSQRWRRVALGVTTPT